MFAGAPMPRCSFRCTCRTASSTPCSPGVARTFAATRARSRFPGGRYDEGESDLVATALREAEEEIGLPPMRSRSSARLQPTPTIATGYAVYPFVGMIEAGRTWTLSAREVAEVLEFSLADLLAGYGRRRLVRRGLPIRTDTYVVGDHLIWGATARDPRPTCSTGIGPLLERCDRSITAHTRERQGAHVEYEQIRPTSPTASSPSRSTAPTASTPGRRRWRAS